MICNCGGRTIERGAMTSTWTFTCSSCGRIERRKLSDQVAYFDDNIISMKKWKRARSANCRPF